MEKTTFVATFSFHWKARIRNEAGVWKTKHQRQTGERIEKSRLKSPSYQNRGRRKKESESKKHKKGRVKEREREREREKGE